MRKFTFFILMFGIIAYLSPVDLSAEHGPENPADHYLSLAYLTPFGFGYKHHLGRNFYIDTDLDYEKQDLRIRTGAAYFFPFRVLIFQFYGGGGLQYSRNNGYDYPYLTIGTRFLIFYSQIIHPWKKDYKPEFRLGMSFRF